NGLVNTRLRLNEGVYWNFNSLNTMRYRALYHPEDASLRFASVDNDGNWWLRFRLRNRVHSGDYSNYVDFNDRIVSEAVRRRTTTLAANMHISADSAGFFRSTSSRRYKLVIEDVEVDPYK